MSNGLTGQLLLAVTSDGANNSILLPANAVKCTFGVILGLCSFDLSFASSVFLPAGIRPCLAASQFANRLDDGTLGRVELSRSFAILKDNVRAAA